MALSDTAKTQSSALAQELLRVARSYIGGWRALLLLAVLAVSAGAALNWSWLVAAGVAPALLTALHVHRDVRPRPVRKQVDPGLLLGSPQPEVRRHSD